MGSSYSNVFVAIGDKTDIVMPTIDDAVRSWVLSDPTCRLAGPDEPATRRVAIAAVPDTGWVAVLDEALDMIPDEAEIIRLATELARATDGVAVATSVFDSDVVQLWLVGPDGLIDRVGRPAAYLADVGQDPGIWSGRPERWTAVAPDVAPRAFADAWDHEDAFAEERSILALGLLGIPATWAASGFRYLSDTVPDATPREQRYVVAIASGLSDAAAPDTPGFVALGHPGPTEAMLGQTVSIFVSMMSRGSGRGVLVVVGGPAIEERLIRPTRVQAATVAASFDDGLAGEAPVSFARLDLSFDGPGSILALSIALIALGQGIGSLWIAIGPIEGFEEGQTVVAVEIAVHEVTRHG